MCQYLFWNILTCSALHFTPLTDAVLKAFISFLNAE